MAESAQPDTMLFDVTPIEVPDQAREIVARIEQSARETLRWCAMFHERFPKAGEGTPASNAIKRFDYLHKQYVGGAPACFNYARDTRIMKDQVEKYGIERVDDLIDRFFKVDSHEYAIAQGGYTVPVFLRLIPRLLNDNVSKPRTHSVTRNTSINRAQSAAAVELIQRR